MSVLTEKTLLNSATAPADITPESPRHYNAGTPKDAWYGKVVVPRTKHSSIARFLEKVRAYAANQEPRF